MPSASHRWERRPSWNIRGPEERRVVELRACSARLRPTCRLADLRVGLGGVGWGVASLYGRRGVACLHRRGGVAQTGIGLTSIGFGRRPVLQGAAAPIVSGRSRNSAPGAPVLFHIRASDLGPSFRPPRSPSISQSSPNAAGMKSGSGDAEYGRSGFGFGQDFMPPVLFRRRRGKGFSKAIGRSGAEVARDFDNRLHSQNERRRHEASSVSELSADM